MRRQQANHRQGTVAVLAAFLLIPLLALVAFAVDYGYLLKMRADLQRTADAAALAAVRDLVPIDNALTQDQAQARTTARTYAQTNLTDGANFSVADSDIVIGRYDTASIYTQLSILNSGSADTVKVTLRRDAQLNSPVTLFFARLMGNNNAAVAASGTAVLQKANIMEAGAEVLPFAVHQDTWNYQPRGSQWSIYGDGKVRDANGAQIPGNWGTVDIGASSNSTADLNDQIENGLTQADLDALYADGRISNREYLDSTNTTFLQADTGLSSGLKNSVQSQYNKPKIVPIYNLVYGVGNNTEFRIVGWGVVQIIDSHWSGNNDTSVTVKKSYMYDNRYLRAQIDLSNTAGTVEGAYTSPVLVE
jgi:Flp pilus assembly protein TadG